MPKVPGVTRDLLQKQILELLEGIGIPAKEWIGKTGSTVRRLVTKTAISPFKPNMLQAMHQQKKTFGDALEAFENEAKFIMNANDQELMNFKNNINTYTAVGGNPKGPGGEGIGSMMKTLETSLKDLETSAKDLKLSTEEAKDFATKQMEEALKTAQYGSPFKVPDKTSFGGNMYNEGNMRTALREFLKTEFKNGRLKLNKDDQFRVMNYSPMSEDDPILVFKRIYGDDAIKNVEGIVNVFEKGESFKHYEQLLRENVDNQFLKPLNQVDVGDGKLVLTEAEEIKPKLPDDDDIPFNLGGRVGMWKGSGKKIIQEGVESLMKKIDDVNINIDPDRPSYRGDWPGMEQYYKEEVGPATDKAIGRALKDFQDYRNVVENTKRRGTHLSRKKRRSREIKTFKEWLEKVGIGSSFYKDGGRVGLKYGTKKLFNFTKKQLQEAVEDIFPTGDRKYDAELVSDALVENNPQMFKNRLRQDLDDSEYTEIYGIALDALDAFNAAAKTLIKEKQGIKSLVKTTEKPTIDFSDPKIKAALEKAGVKGIALSDAAKKMGYDMSKQKDFFAWEEAIAGGMEGFPKEIKEQVIRAKYGDVVDQRLLDNMLVDDDPYRLAEVFATVEQGLKMQEMGMGGDEIVTAIKADIKRKPNAAGGGVGSLFSPTDRVGLFKGSSEIAKSLGISAKEYAQRVHSSGGKKIKEILDDLMRHKKIRALVEKVNKDLHETGIAKMWHEKRAVDDENKIVAEKVIAPFVETVDKMVPWKLSDKSQRNATLAWFRESITNPRWRKDYRPDWEQGKTVFRGMKHPDDLIYSKDHPSNMFAKQQYAKMFKPENVGGFASTDPSYAIKFAKEAKGMPHVTKTHLDPIEFQEAVERNIIENPYGSTGDVILNEEQKKALETDIVSSGIALIKKYMPFNKGGSVNKQKVYKHGVGSMFKEI